jgi:hypothetical protein
MRRRTKVLLAVIGALVAAVIVLALLLSTGALTPSLRGRIASGITAATCRPTTVGRVQIGLTGRAVLRDVVLHYDDGSPLATIPEATVQLAGGLGKGLPSIAQIREIAVRNPTVRLVRSKEGKWPTFGTAAAPGKPVQFPERIQITNGTFTFVDEQRKSSTTVHAISLAATSPEAGKLDFTLQAAGEKSEFVRLTAQGDYVAKNRRAQIKLNVSDVNLTYAWSLLPPVRGIKVAGGRADIEGTVTIASAGAGKAAAVTPELTIRPRATSVSFPWLRQPVQDVTGTIRLADSNVTVASATGRIAGAPITARGTVKNLAHPALDLQFTSTGIGLEQVRALFPTVSLPAGVTVRGPMRVVAQAQGTSPDISVTGQARVSEIVLACIPWHDMVAYFAYRRGQLDVTDLRAHGSPRELEADIRLRLSPKPLAAEASVTMRNVSLSLLEGCFPQLRAADLKGTADLSLQLNTVNGVAAQGSFAARDVAYRGVPVGAVSGDFTTRDTTVQVTHGTVAGPTATGTFSGTVSSAGAFSVEAEFSALDLSALKLPLPVTPSSAAIRLSGSVPQSRASGHIALTFPAAQRLVAQTLSADIAVTRRELALTGVTLQAAEGQATGQITVRNWRAGPAARLSGGFQLSDVPIREWLPPEYVAALPPSLVSGTLEVGGNIADPSLTLKLQLATPPTAPTPGAEIGRARLAYEHGELRIEEFEVTTPQVHVAVSGTISPTAGIDITATGVTVDLAALSALTSGTLGLALSGAVLVDVTATGPLRVPNVTFQIASADGITVNDVPFRELLIAGQLANGVVTLDTASVRQEDGSIAATGTANLLTRQLDLVVTLRDLDLFNAMFLSDQAVWRRYYVAKARPVSGTYAAIPRPLGGSLSASIQVTGPVLGPEIQVADLAVDRFSFRGREVAQVRGSLTLTLAAGALRTIDIPIVEATEQNAIARLWGSAVFGGAVDLNADVSSLDLGLLEPWLPGISGLKGQASVNVDITGPTSNPRLRGDVFVDNFKWRNFGIARAEFSPIVWENNQIVIQSITLRSGPMEATGAVRLVVGAALGQGPQFADVAPSGWLRVTNGSFTPLLGMTPAVFNAYLELSERTLYIEEITTQGPLATTPGVVGTLGGGRFTVTGTIEFPSFRLTELGQAKYDLTIDLGAARAPVGLEIKDFLSVKLAGRLRVLNGTVEVDDHQFTGPVLQTEKGHPVIVSNGWVGVPPKGQRILSQGLSLGAPLLADLLLLAGPGLRFEYGPVKAVAAVGGPTVDPTTGYLYARGPLTAQDLTLNGRFDSHSGTVKFPAGTLDIEQARAEITKTLGQLPQIYISARATGTVGDYFVSLNPTGRIYPPPGPAEPPLSLGIRTIPSLSEPLALALLIGSVVAPGPGTVAGPLDLLLHPGETLPRTGTLTGLTVPGLGAPGVAVNWLFQGPLVLVLRQRLFGKFYASYASPLGGPVVNEQLTFTYQVSRRWSLGWSVNGLDQTRWQVQSFAEF